MFERVVVIAYRFQTLPEHPKLGVLITKEPPVPAIFLTPVEAKLTVKKGERITIALIQCVVAKYYELPPEHMRSSSHNRKHVYPRWMAMLLSRELTKSSLPDIGRRFGGRDHSTIIHGIREIKKHIIESPAVDYDYETLRAKFVA